jgi:hypothetical protein
MKQFKGFVAALVVGLVVAGAAQAKGGGHGGGGHGKGAPGKGGKGKAAHNVKAHAAHPGHPGRNHGLNRNHGAAASWRSGYGSWGYGYDPAVYSAPYLPGYYPWSAADQWYYDALYLLGDPDYLAPEARFAGKPLQVSERRVVGR